MEGKALILTLVLTVVNSHGYYGKDRPDSIFDTIPHVLHDMIKGHRNMHGNNYNQQPNTFDPENRYGGRINSGYQQDNMGYQNSGIRNGYNMPNNHGFANQEPQEDEGFTARNPSNYNPAEIPTTHITSTESAPETLHLSINPPLVLNSSTPNTDKAHPSNTKRDINSLTNSNKAEKGNNKPQHNTNASPPETDKKLNNAPLLNKEKETARVNKPRNPNAIVFPDNIEEVKKEAQENRNSNASELPSKFNDTPQIVYAVNIAPSGTSHWSSNPEPLTNSITQNPPLTNGQTFAQTPNQASYATLITPNQAPLTNKVAQSYPFGNSIVLPNENGGSSLYTIVNLPSTIANADVPSNSLQSSNVVSNPSNYQVQTSIPTANGGILNGMPAYYVVSMPTQPSQTVQTSVPYTNVPAGYSVGYISSNGQTVLVPSPTTVYQLIPQTFVPYQQGNVQSTYVPVFSGQPNVISQPITNQGNTAAVTYVTVPNSQDASNARINYGPLINAQENTASQPNYVTVSSGQGNTGAQINVVPNVQESAPNTQTNYVPVNNGQSNLESQPNYVTVSSSQGITGNQLNLLPVSNNDGNTQNYVPVSSDQNNVLTLTSAPSDTMVLPADTQTVTLLSFKDKAEEKQKKKASKKKSKKK